VVTWYTTTIGACGLPLDQWSDATFSLHTKGGRLRLRNLYESARSRMESAKDCNNETTSLVVIFFFFFPEVKWSMYFF
jgi:hypothetical protein